MHFAGTGRPIWQSFILALVLVVLAAAARVWPLHALGLRAAYVTFYPAVMLACLFGGLAPGMVAVFFSCIAVMFLWPESFGQPFAENFGDWLSMAVFVINCTMISGVTDAMHRAHRRANEVQSDLERGNAELKAARDTLEEEVNKRTADLIQSNARLEKELSDRKRAEEELARAHAELEQKVLDRTAELGLANERLILEIEQRRRAEESLAAERQRLFAILETMPVMVCLLTPDYHVAFANRSFREQFGEDNQRHCFEYRFGMKEPCEFCETYNVLKTGKPHRWGFVRPDGSVIDAYDFPFTDINGSPLILEVNIDVTEQRRVEEAVGAERQRLYQVLDTLPAYVVLLSEDYHVPFANRFFRERFGESQGKRCYEYLFGRTEPCEICETYTVMQTRAPHRWIWVGPDGRDYDIHDFPFTDSDGSQLVMEVGIDITEAKRAEAALNKTLADLTRSNEDLQQFAYVASHDLQEPLRNIAGCMQMLEKKYKSKLDSGADQYIHHAVEGAVRMKALIQDLLEYSRVGTRGKRLEPTDSGQVLKQTMRILRPAISEIGAVITHNRLPTVFADDTQLVQVFQNLIANAIKFRRDDPPRIHVSAVKNKNEWIFSVRDNGIGIESRHMDRIFVIFQRLNKRTEYEGTGMGLAIVKKVVERHGGRVWVESEPGVGTTFYFSMPEKRIRT
ncbi:MAG TPA: ATP-binding protein [Desulfomonilaceae bacterium]|nr:ATP-binding protein [Desulfomonilaceae bacterium]